MKVLLGILARVVNRGLSEFKRHYSKSFLFSRFGLKSQELFFWAYICMWLYSSVLWFPANFVLYCLSGYFILWNSCFWVGFSFPTWEILFNDSIKNIFFYPSTSCKQDKLQVEGLFWWPSLSTGSLGWLQEKVSSGSTSPIVGVLAVDTLIESWELLLL